MLIRMTRFRTGIVAIAAASALLTGTAGASGGSTAAANTLMIGSGSATTYNMMQAMDTLYNDSPGCNLIDITSVTQELDFGCPSAAQTTPPPNVSVANAPYPDFATSSGYTENPANDVSTQEPPYGSGNGIKQLETSSGTSACTSTNPTAPLDFARSSRALGSGDCKGLNFVAYAVDGVSWFHYTSVNGHATPSASVSNLSQALLTDAYNGSLQCWNDPVVAAGSGTPSDTYSTPGCQPIILYTAQAGSGTTNTWQSFVGVNPATYLSTLNGTSFNIQKPDGTTGAQTYNSNDHIILENEDREIITVGDEANALFFYSYGKFNVTCKKGLCGKIPGGSGATTAALPQINGVTATKTTILCGAGLQTNGCTNFFSPTRFVYNVYSNGSNPNIPRASFNALNYVSELGFICKPNTTDGTQTASKQILDPNTGTTYRKEITAVITGQGFLAIPFQSHGEGSVPNSAYGILHPHTGDGGLHGEIASVDTVGQKATKSVGYCLVSTTDNNTNS